LTTIADTAGGRFSSFGAAAINDAGTVAFLGILNDRDRTQGIFAGPGGATLIVGTNSDVFSQFGNPAINNAGTVAVFGGLQDGIQAIFTGNGGPVTARTDLDNPPFIEFEHPSINNAGEVTFFAIDGDGVGGIFVELTGRAAPAAVIQTGDSLFGSTVTSLDMGRFGFNDSDQLAFEFTLADGRTGVALASLTVVPEPSSLNLLLPVLGVLGVLLVRRRK
jgi:hypothetical protein